MRYGTGVLLVVIAGILWSAMGLAIRQIVVADSWAVLFWRSVGMMPVLAIAILWLRGGVLAPVRETGLAGVIGGAALVIAFAGAIYSIQATTVANAVFLFAASPFLAAGLGWALLGERVRGATWAAIGLAGVGMFLMVREGLAIGAGWGNVAALLSALGFAAFTLALRWGRLADMLPAILLGGVFSMVVAAGVTWMQGGTLWVPLHDIAVAMAAGAVLLATGLALYTRGSRVIPAAELTLLSMIEVLLAPVWVFVFLRESATAGTFLGGAVVLGAVILNALSGLRARPPLPPTPA